MDRLTLEQINNMTTEQMREYLRGQEVENQRNEAIKQAAEAEARRKEEESMKEMNDFFERKFSIQRPKVHDQY